MNITTNVPSQRHDFNTGVRTSFEDTVINEYHLTLEITALESIQFTSTNNQLTELVVGYLYTVGLISRYTDIIQFKINQDESIARATLSTPINTRIPYPRKPIDYDINEILNLIKEFHNKDKLFELTGALHCCLIMVENEVQYKTLDMGRHNAIDKAIGLALIDGVDFSKTKLLTSGRTPAEIVEKAIYAGIPTIVSRSAPTKQAVQLAEEYGINLLGFAGLERVNIYT